MKTAGDPLVRGGCLPRLAKVAAFSGGRGDYWLDLAERTSRLMAICWRSWGKLCSVLRMSNGCLRQIQGSVGTPVKASTKGKAVFLGVV